MPGRRLAVVTGASTGIGFELAAIAAQDGYDLVVAANDRIEQAAARLGEYGGAVRAVDADLATTAGVEAVIAAVAGRPIDVLCANAGTALGHAFLNQPVDRWRHVVDTNVTGTLLMLHKILPAMIARESGRVLVTGSINGSIPGPYLAVYNATKAFLNNFTDALRDELRDTRVTLTTLMPGPVDTPVYARAEMLDTLIGAAPKPAADGVARAGWDAMCGGHDRVVPGLLNKVIEAGAHVIPAGVVAAVHRVVAKPR